MKNFTNIFFFILLGDLVARAMQPDWQLAEYIFKPLLMVSLGFYFVNATILRGVRQKQFVFAAIVFSLLGDIFLMFEGYFIQGLGAFLIAHIFYILAFQPESSRFFFKKRTPDSGYCRLDLWRYFAWHCSAKRRFCLENTDYCLFFHYFDNVIDDVTSFWQCVRYFI